MVDGALIAQYGQPTRVDSAAALAAAGLPGDIGPDDVIAFVYSSREAGEAFQAVNRDEHNVPPLALVETDDGWLGVNDLRPSLAALKAKYAKNMQA